MQLRYRRHYRSAERNKPFTPQHQAADVSIFAIMRIVETKRTLEAEPTIFLPAHAQTDGMDALVKPLHARDATGVTTQGFGAFSGGAAGVPERERHRRHDHQDD
jgi:hypothetical protein